MNASAAIADKNQRAIPPGRGGFRPEVELLLCCGQACASPQTDARILELLARGLDWNRLLRTAAPHGMLSLLFWKLNELQPQEGAVPPEIMGRLKGNFALTAARNLSLTRELLRLLALLKSQGITAVPFKGPMLATAAYGNLALRPFADLDLLVHRPDVPRARAIMTAQDYVPRYDLKPSQEAGLLRFACEYPFQRREQYGNNGHSARQEVNVDIHWELFPPSFSLPLDAEKFWQRLETLNLAGAPVSTFATEDLLLYLCVHGFAHHWNRLEWIAVLARLIENQPDLHWNRLEIQAERTGGERILLMGLLLAHDLMGAPVPPRLVEKAHGAPSIGTLISYVRHRLHQDPAMGRTNLDEGFLFDLEARGNPLKRSQYFLRRSLIPSVEDIEWLALPQPLFPLYYLLRPIRLLRRRNEAEAP